MVRLLKYQDLPDWMKDNEYILSGYRQQSNSYYKSMLSMFYFHNETGNIFSHLFGQILFLCLMTSTILKFSVEAADLQDYIIIFIFMTCAVLCFLFSWIFHLFSNHSESKVTFWCKMDYVGIILLIIGSFYPAIYYGFYSRVFWCRLYLTIITVVGFLTLIVFLDKRAGSPEFRLIRTCIFMGLGISGIVPVLHCMILYGIDVLIETSFFWFILMGVGYISGALLYASRLPEKTNPGKFDYFLGSHQIFHILVVLSALCHYIGTMKLFKAKEMLSKL